MRSVLLTLLLATVAAPASAQIDFSGEWAPCTHEDGPERGPGPELGDYTEIPINDAARLRADSWDATGFRSSPRPVPAARRRLRASRVAVGNMRIWRDRNRHAAARRVSHAWLAFDSERIVGWMAVRIPRRTLSTRGRGFRRACGTATRSDHDHASERELPAAQRTAAKRSGGADRALDPPSRLPDDCHGYRRSMF